MSNELLPLTCENLAEYDGGRIGAAFNTAIKNAVRDLVDRAGDNTTRKITLTIELTPECDLHGNLESIEVEAYVQSKVPCLPEKLTVAVPRLSISPPRLVSRSCLDR